VRSIDERCRAIADQFDQGPDALRLRKLLHCLCHGGWENDPDRLAQFYLPGLVQLALSVAPRPQDLRYRLGRIVKHLNRQRQYTRLANQLVVGLQPLYQSETDLLAEPSGLAALQPPEIAPQSPFPESGASATPAGAGDAPVGVGSSASPA
jgi:hypothetical protein